MIICTYVFVDAVLVDSPHGGHMGGEQLLEWNPLVASPGADEPRLADGRVADHDALDELLVGLLIIHLTSTWPEAPHRPSFRTLNAHSATKNGPKTLKSNLSSRSFKKVNDIKYLLPNKNMRQVVNHTAVFESRGSKELKAQNVAELLTANTCVHNWYTICAADEWLSNICTGRSAAESASVCLAPTVRAAASNYLKYPECAALRDGQNNSLRAPTDLPQLTYWAFPHRNQAIKL